MAIELDRERLLVELTGVFHDRDLNLPTRTLYLGPDVGPVTTERFLKNLHVLESIGGSRIMVLLNNCGGDDYNGLAIFDAIRMSPCSIHMKVRGAALSMGSVILQAADKRFMAPLATQMLHYGTTAAEAHARTFQRAAREAQRINEWMEEMYLERIREKQPKFTLDALRDLLDHDTYLTAQESIDLGLADAIG